MKKFIISGIALMAPFMAMAATLGDVVDIIRDIVDTIVPLLMVVAVVVFLWGIVKFITSAGDEEKKTGAKNLIIYGLIGLFVMVAFWGIIKIVAGTFGVQEGGTIPLPIINP